MISALMPNYNRADLAFERGEGAWLWTVDGRRFLDFGAGIATSSIGHNNPVLVKAIAEQAAKVMHVSNLYRIPQAEKLAARLVENSFADTAFFCNSGAEANEGMIKMMRRTRWRRPAAPSASASSASRARFHGRTLATLAATGNPHYQEGFGPPVEGFDHAPLNNMNAVRNLIGPQTAGVIVEPVQGEGGVRPADPQFLRDLRAACDEFGLLLGPRRGAVWHGPHRKVVRLRMVGHRARCHVARQGHRRRLSARRRAGQGGGGQASRSRHAWNHLRRQPARLRRRQRGAGRDARAGVHRGRRAARASVSAPGSRAWCASIPDVFRRGARARAVAGPEMRDPGRPKCSRPASPKGCSRSPRATTCCVLHRRWW